MRGGRREGGEQGGEQWIGGSVSLRFKFVFIEDNS